MNSNSATILLEGSRLRLKHGDISGRIGLIPKRKNLRTVIVGLIKNAVELRTRAIEREQEARRREEQQRRQEEIARRKREEEARLQNLLNQTENWHRSKQIREYIQAVKEDTIRKNGGIEPGKRTRQMAYPGEPAGGPP
jgi:predicted Holliday junction resolvase-like endonuclease